jgi:myo-inositol 2-dehydrogenase/D-chiro-inositol 1-dehydrogenase
MTATHQSLSAGSLSRRSLLGSSVAAAAAAAIPGGAFAAGSDRIRIGLVGCGGRGLGAALQALTADAGVEIAALGDLFADQLHAAAAAVTATGRAAPGTLAHGAAAADRVIAADIDAVILATPPCFRPAEIAAAVQAGRHIYAEAPVGVDAAGVRAAAAAVDAGRQRGLALASGLASRHHEPMRSTIAAIEAGAIGRPMSAVAIRHVGLPWVRPVQPGWSADDAAVRNWIAHPRLSGGGLLSDLVPAIDRCVWALGDPTPLEATALPAAVILPVPPSRAREAAVRIAFADGAVLEARILRREGIEDLVEERVCGTAGSADLRRQVVAGKPFASSPGDAGGHAACMKSFIASLRAAPRRDDLADACRSTMLAVMARTAVEAGATATWQDLWRSATAPRPA